MFLLLRDFLVFTPLVAILFYLLGAYLIWRLKIQLTRDEHFVFATGIGLVSLTLVAYGLSWLRLNWILPLIVAYIVASYLFHRPKILAEYSKKEFFGKGMIITLCLMSLVFLIPFYASGDFGSFISLIGVHKQDSALHVAMINELKRSFPPMDPGFAGNRLMGYHFFYNFSAATISNLTRMPSVSMHFRVMPLIFALLWPFLAYMAAKRLFKIPLAALFTVFFSMFGASFTYFIAQYYHLPISANSGLGILQPPGSLLNPPFAASVVVLLMSMYILIRFEETKDFRWLFLIPISFGSLVEYKVYAGITGLAGLGIYVLLRLSKFGWKMALAGLLALAVAFAVYWPFTGAAGFLVYAPLWAPHEIARASLTFLRYDNAVYEYQRLLDPIRSVILEVKVLAYFILGNFGLRILGLAGLYLAFRRMIRERILIVIFLVMFLTAFFIPLMFMQSLKPLEISQMFNYALLILSFPTGYFFANLVAKRSKFVIIIIGIVLLAFSLPQFPTDYQQYLVAPAKTIGGNIYALYRQIRKEKPGNAVMLEVPPRSVAAKDYRGWFRSATNMELSAFTDTRAFLAFTNIIYSESEVEKRVAALADLTKVVKDYQITYLYSYYPLTEITQSGIATLRYSSPTVYVYLVK